MIQKSLTWITAILENMFFAGIIFGWANIEPVLQKEGYFSEGCSNVSVPNNVTMITEEVIECKSQEEKLSLVFSLATSGGLLFNIIVGPAMDYLGIWTVRTFLIIIAVLTLLITGIATSQMLYLTFPILHIAGLGLHVTNIQMANIFHNNRNLYVSSITGSFMSGSLTFLTFSYFYDNYNISFESLFTVYSIIYSFLNLRTFFLTPRVQTPENITENFIYGYKDLVELFLKYTKLNPEKEILNKSKNNNESKEADFKTFACSLLFITTVLSNSVANFIYMLYISNFDLFIYSLFQNEKESEKSIEFYASIFGFLQFTGLFFTVLNCATSRIFKGKEIEKGSNDEIKCCLTGIFIGSVCTVGMQVCTALPSAKLQLLSMILHVVGKAFFTSSSNTYISIIFPAKIFGRLYSVMAVSQALFLLMQIPLAVLMENILNRNFVLFNSCLVIVSLLILVQPIYMLYCLKRNLFSS